MGLCMSSDGRKFKSKPLPGLSPEEFNKQAEERKDLDPLENTAYWHEETDLLVCAFFHFSGDNAMYDVHIPRDIIWLLSGHLLQSLKIDKGKICSLQAGIEYTLDELHLEPWAMLTCDAFDRSTGEGGILCLKIKRLILEQGASINLTNKGFPMVPKSALKGACKQVAEKYGLKLGLGPCGGGAIYIECTTFECNGGNILAISHYGGQGGTIMIVIDGRAELNGNSKIWAPTGTIRIQCRHEDASVFTQRSIDFKESYETVKKDNIRPRPDMTYG